MASRVLRICAQSNTGLRATSFRGQARGIRILRCRKLVVVELSRKIRELKNLADDGELEGDDLEFVEHVDELTGNGGAATLLSEGEARRVDELYKAVGG